MVTELIDELPEWKRKGVSYTDINRSGFSGTTYLEDDGTISIKGFINSVGPFCIFFLTDEQGKVTQLL